MSDLKWRDLWTERDGDTPCFVRILTAIGVSSFIALTTFAVLHGQSFSYSDWAIGFATIVAGGAGAARLKLQTENEPDADEDDNHSGASRDWNEP